MGEANGEKRQYHPPFCASLELEFRGLTGAFEFTPEYQLNNKPNAIDLLITTKRKAGIKSNGLSAIFRKYNLIEFRSPKDVLSQRIYYRSVAYAYLLAAYNREVASIDEVTITFIRQGRPVKLMRLLKERGYRITAYEPGIYHARKSGQIDLQIIVTRRLGDKYKWLNKLTDQLELEDVKSMMSEIQGLKDERDLMNAESVFDLMVKLNRDKDWMKELRGMGAFRDLFKEDFEERDRKIAELSKQLQSKNEQLQSKDEQLQSKDEQLQSKDEQLQSQNEQLQSQNEQLQSQNEQLQSQNEQLANEKAENSRLRQELENLKKQLGRIAVI